MFYYDSLNFYRDTYTLPHPIWTKDETLGVEITHRKPKGFTDWAAYSCVSFLRVSFDILSGYKKTKYLDTMDEKSVLTRCIFLETVAGVPGKMFIIFDINV